MSYAPKGYIVQKYDRHGNPGEVIGYKLTFNSAQELSKANAPAKVIFAIGDKTPLQNIPVPPSHQTKCS